MKRIVLSFLALIFTLSLTAQLNDTILLEQVESLKKELSSVKKKHNSLQSRVYQLQKAHEKDLGEASSRISSLEKELQSSNNRISEQQEALKVSEENTAEGLKILGEWTKKVILIVGIVALVLFIILLILIITNRRKIEDKYTKLEAKVDNTKDAIELELKEVLKKHEDDITALKALVQKDKK